MKLLILTAAISLSTPAFAADGTAPPPAPEKKVCRHHNGHSCKAERTRQAKPASGTFREENSHIAAAPMAPSLPPPAG